MLDLATDITMIKIYSTTDQGSNAYSLLAMVLICLVFQLWLVYAQTSGGPLKYTLQEFLIVLSGLKPGFDAARVARGKAKNEHNAVDPATELAFCKGAELFCESIPGCILQINACMLVLQVSERSECEHSGAVIIANERPARQAE